MTNMSHDIRTPMNAIIGLTNLMQHDLNNPEKLQAYIDKLHTSSEHLLGLINDVLDMSKIESGAVTLRMDEVNLAEQIEQIEAIIRPQTRQRGQHFIVRASQIHHENFIGDATRLPVPMYIASPPTGLSGRGLFYPRRPARGAERGRRPPALFGRASGPPVRFGGFAAGPAAPLLPPVLKKEPP